MWTVGVDRNEVGYKVDSTSPLSTADLDWPPIVPAEIGRALGLIGDGGRVAKLPSPITMPCDTRQLRLAKPSALILFCLPDLADPAA